MSVQPLTNANPAIVIVGPNDVAINEALVEYNIPSDPGDVTPPVTVYRFTDYTAFNDFIAGNPDQALDFVVLQNTDWRVRNLGKAWFGEPVTLAKALLMVNNEVAIRRDQIIANMVPQK